MSAAQNVLPGMRFVLIYAEVLESQAFIGLSREGLLVYIFVRWAVDPGTGEIQTTWTDLARETGLTPEETVAGMTEATAVGLIRSTEMTSLVVEA